MDALPTGRPTADIIPYFDIAEGGPVDLCGLAPERLESLIEAGRAHYGSAALAVGDGISRSWLTKARNPYVEEIDRIAETVGTAGAFLLNLSYKWTCTTCIGRDPSGRGNRLLRTLDWPLDGLGRNVVVARQGRAGRQLFQCDLAGLHRRLDGDGTRAFFGCNQPTAHAPLDPKLLVRLGDQSGAHLAKPRLAARSPVASGFRNLCEL